MELDKKFFWNRLKKGENSTRKGSRRDGSRGGVARCGRLGGSGRRGKVTRRKFCLRGRDVEKGRKEKKKALSIPLRGKAFTHTGGEREEGRRI